MNENNSVLNKKQKRFVDYVKSGDYWIFQFGILFKLMLALIEPLCWLIVMIVAIDLINHISNLPTNLRMLCVIVWAIMLIVVTNNLFRMRIFKESWDDIE